MRNALSTLAASWIALVAVAAHAADMPPAPSPATRAYVAATLFADIGQSFAPWQVSAGYDLDSAFRAYLDKAMAAPDRLAFDLETQAFLAGLDNGRTRFADAWMAETHPAPPFTVRRIAQDWVVTASRVEALKPGDVIAQVAGTPTETLYQAQAPYIAGNNDEARRAQLFTLGALLPAPLVLGLADGRSVTVDPAAATPAPTRETSGKWLKPDQIALIAIPGFDDPALEAKAVTLAKEYAEAPTLVVDLRGNRGGTMPLALLTALMNRPYRSWSIGTPIPGGENGRHASVNWSPTTTTPTGGAFGRQLILLIDGGCLGACEDFVLPFKDNGRAVLIGEATGGSTGQARTLALGDGMSAAIADTIVRFPDGAPFEGIGIQPDVLVGPKASDLKAGLDPVIAKVLIQTAPGAQQDHRAP